jgi:hypothetical protein
MIIIPYFLYILEAPRCIIKDVNGSYWWNNMKRNIAKFVEQCPTCQQEKAEHQRLAGMLKPLLIPK